MRISGQILGIVLVTACLLSLQSRAFAETLTASGPERAITAAAEDNKPIFILFYKEQDAAGDAIVGALKSNAAIKSQEAAWTSVRVSDPAERRVAEKFKMSRAPMPTLVAVHPNGAVTGVYPKKVTQANLSESIVSPKMAECLKLLQDNRLVLICVQTSPTKNLPQGVRDFKADPHFAKRASILTVSAGDSDEAKFLSGMDVDLANLDSPVTVFLAPPGSHVGTFPVSASKDELADALAAAGKCCNDKNCKHNQKTK